MHIFSVKQICVAEFSTPAPIDLGLVNLPLIPDKCRRKAFKEERRQEKIYLWHLNHDNNIEKER